MAARASYKAVPSMFMVAPTGSTKRVTRLSTLLFSSRHLKVMGNVAELRKQQDHFRWHWSVPCVTFYCSNSLPRRCTKGSYKCLQQPSNEYKWVLSGDDEVKCWQDYDGVDEQATNNRHCVHSQLTSHSWDIVHFYNFTSDQKQDTNGGIPEEW